MFKKKCPTCVKMISYLLAQAPASLRRCQTCSPCTLTTAADCAGLFLYQTSWWDGHFMGSGDKEAQVMVTHAHIHTLWQSHARVRLLPPNQPVRRRREHRARDGVSKSERELPGVSNNNLYKHTLIIHIPFQCWRENPKFTEHN